MSMPPPPPDTRAAGQSGHIADHNTISDALTGLEGAVGTLQATAVPSGTPSAGQVAVATGPSGATAWTTLTASSVGADASGAAATVLAASLQRTANLSDLGSAPAAQANLLVTPSVTDFQAGDALGRQYVPVFTKASSNPFMTIANQPLTSMQWPSAIYVGDIFGGAGPYGEYWRVYYSTDHANAVGSGIGLLTCNSMIPETGTWTAHGFVFTDTTGSGNNQTETPTVIYVPDAPAGPSFYMYYHRVGTPTGGPNEITKLATMTVAQARVSESWTISSVNSGVVLDTPADTIGGWPANLWAYMRPFRVGQEWIAHTLMTGNPLPFYTVARSRTGLPGSWTQDARPMAYEAHHLADPQGRFNQSSHNVAWNSGAVFRWKGQMWWFGMIAAIAGGGGSPGYEMFIAAPISSDYRRLLGTAAVMVTSTQSWEITWAGAPAGMAEYQSGCSVAIGPDGKLRLFYQGAGGADPGNGTTKAAAGAFGIAVAS